MRWDCSSKAGFHDGGRAWVGTTVAWSPVQVGGEPHPFVWRPHI